VDIFATGKAIDLYSAEMNRRIEEKDKTIKEKEQTIQKHKNRELTCAWMFVVGLCWMMIAIYLTINHMWCT
jgi:hypothetical protein